MLITILAVLAACAGGFWVGSYHTRRVWERIVQGQVHQAHHEANCGHARVTTRVLQYLADGKQSEARAVLERHLDFALVQVVAYERLYNPEGRGGIELGVVRSARDYRAQHPWASEPDKAKEVQQAFKWAD